MDGLSVSVVLPVFNETDCILDVLKELTTVLESEKFEKYEVIPVGITRAGEFVPAVD
ncbi:MAG: hypothetical protein RLZZ94_1041, partial [Bacteroidota bacterium]